MGLCQTKNVYTCDYFKHMEDYDTLKGELKEEEYHSQPTNETLNSKGKLQKKSIQKLNLKH